MSNANSQDSSNPKPPTEGIAESPPRQLAPSVGNLLVVGAASASSPTSSTSPRVSPISFGSFEFTPHPHALRPAFVNTPVATELVFGSFKYSIDSEGALRLPDPTPSDLVMTAAAPAASSASSPPGLLRGVVVGPGPGQIRFLLLG